MGKVIVDLSINFKAGLMRFCMGICLVVEIFLGVFKLYQFDDALGFNDISLRVE